jgi:hypothetical protein
MKWVRGVDGSLDWGLMNLMPENHFCRLITGTGSPAPVFCGHMEETVINGYAYSHYLLGESLHLTGWQRALVEFEFCASILKGSTLFKLASMGRCCGCRTKRTEFDWRGSGLCRECNVRAGNMMSEGEIDRYLSQLVKGGYVAVGGDGNMLFNGRCDLYYDAEGRFGVWKEYNGIVCPQGHNERERRFADEAAAVSRFMMYGAPLNEAKIGEVLYENSVLCVLPYLRAIFHHVVRELDAAMRCDEVKRSFSPITLGLMDKICCYTSDSIIRDKGVWMEDGYCPVDLEKWSGGWEVSQGLLFQGPYDVVARGNGVEFLPNVVKATSILNDWALGLFDYYWCEPLSSPQGALSSLLLWRIQGT